MSGFSHLDEQGRIRMVDVGDKPVTDRLAVAVAEVHMLPATLAALAAGELPKGNVLTTAHVAGVMAAKRCAELIPLCHSLPLSGVDLSFQLDTDRHCVVIRASCHVRANTGVEMEALTAASVAALTIYDMCKAIDKHMRIDGVRVVEKRGGRSGDFVASDKA
ncbi:cyclic pyranopterin monophosphate synthase MoaC [Permianibacter sp. IMCC34836]|uniref:cyclic pyranopterin monophosphate synthase MoaC n=1 Tax=Permianibacter fluminis TaxID=2738515 RepID=UPI0015527382|nr:cyclic pyranopterin monophosphate synthase MoaC [Permianibacter fluminis]NQD37813.1 cyclic pyranopterin monophosphate synthase MoaC [Permianibacter fluminis]